MAIDIQIAQSGSLKAKRSVVKHVLEVARRRYGVSASEVGHHGTWQRAALGFSVVAPSAGQAEEILDKVERFVWSNPEVTVLSSVRHWVEVDT
ncbi:MAG TPA: DUF503 domain-containing protein [Acidimicrobiales bacterium]|nr:DUF503 domain-containing protein [Acidimicrobiales bacterium]